MIRKKLCAISRRTFLGATAAAVMSRRMANAEATKPASRYVDIHCHLGQQWGNREPLGAKQLLEWMDAHDIAQAVVLPLVSPESWDHILTTDYVLMETAAHRDRLIPFCSIDPRTIQLGSESAKRDMLKKYVEAGAKGFGEHKCGIAMDDPRNIAWFHACADHGLPILFHIDNDRNMDSPGLPGLAKVLEAVPNGVFIGHATGWWASISGDATQKDLGGYPTTKVTPGGALDRLFDTYPNIYGDLSAGSGSNAIARDKAFGREFMIRRADRLLFGTDYLSPGQQVDQFALFEELDLPEDVQAKIYRDNARRVLGLAL